MNEEQQNPYLGQILLFHGRGLLSALVRWQTRGEYSHAAIRVGENECIEAWGSGVRLKRITDWDGIDAYNVFIPHRSKVLAVSFAAQQIDKKYDFLGVLRFVSRRPKNNPSRWFCSELVFEAFKHAGWELLARSQAWEVSPDGLKRSPLLTLTNRVG